MSTTAESPTNVDLSKSVAAALTLRERPSPPSALSAALTHGWRAMLKIKHVPEQLFDVTLFPIMFTLMFTFLFGGALEGSTKAYAQYVLPGILVQTVAMITMYTGQTMNNDIGKGVFDRFKSLPAWRSAPLVGALLADVVRFAIASTIIIVLGMILGFRPEGGAIGVVLAVALLLFFCFCLGWVWDFVGLVARTPQSVMGISMMVLFPLTFLSNVFVNPDTMPGWLQAVVDVNPITHLVSACRGLMAGDPSGTELAWVFASSAILLVIFVPLTMYRYNRR